jgi:dCTP deaminase
MTLLSDTTIRQRLSDASLPDWQRLVISPFDLGAIQPCSVDLHLDGPLKIYTGPRCDTRRDNARWWQLVDYDTTTGDLSDDRARAWVLQPGRFYLGVVDEAIVVPEDACGQLVGLSSRARDGVTIHQQAGLLDPGWIGRATLEITVSNPHTILYRGQRIAQVTFTLLDGRCSRPYRGRYHGDLQAQPARLGEAGVR